MARVLIEGAYLGAAVKKRAIEGKPEETYVQIDVYQPEAESANKTITIKCEDVTIIERLHKDFAMGSVIKALCNLNAFKNQAYFKLVTIVK